jgi:hypothetical protein
MDNFPHGGDGPVDVLIRGEAAEAEADCSTGAGIQVLVNQGGAVKPDADGNIEVPVKNGTHIFRIHAFDIGAQNRHVTAKILSAAQLHIL